MENLIEAPSEVRVIGDSAACGMTSCDEGAAIALRGTPLCVRHFIPVCTQEIESRGERLKNGLYDEAATLAFKNFISACAEQASHFIQDNGFTDGSTKSRLEEFSSARVAIGAAATTESADELFCAHLSSTRGFRAHLGRRDAWTITVSQHGASLVCRHPVETGGALVLSRRDRANRVQARVVYCRYNSEGWREIGVELLDRDDFWGLSQAARMQPSVLPA